MVLKVGLIVFEDCTWFGNEIWTQNSNKAKKMKDQNMSCKRAAPCAGELLAGSPLACIGSLLPCFFCRTHLLLSMSDWLQTMWGCSLTFEVDFDQVLQFLEILKWVMWSHKVLADWLLDCTLSLPNFQSWSLLFLSFILTKLGGIRF